MASSRTLRKNMVSQVSSCSGLADLIWIGQGHVGKSPILSLSMSRNEGSWSSLVSSVGSSPGGAFRTSSTSRSESGRLSWRARDPYSHTLLSASP